MPVHFFVLSTVIKQFRRNKRIDTTIMMSAQRGASIYSLPSFKSRVPNTRMFACGYNPIIMYPRTTVVMVMTVAQNWNFARGRLHNSVSDSSEIT